MKKRVNMVTFFTILAAVLLVASQCHGEITLNPPILTFDENVTVTTLSFTCEISRHPTNGTLVGLFLIENENNVGLALADQPPLLLKNISGASIKGNVNQSITITMTQTSCKNGGEYVCVTVYSIPLSSHRAFSENYTLPVVVKPGRTVAMTVSPRKPQYSLNDTVQLSCSSLIGSNNLFLEVLWIWEYMDDNQNKIWIKYPDSNITNDPPIFINISCQNRQVTYIFRNLTREDNRRTYRCYITWKGIVYTENAPTYLFTVVGGESYNKSNEIVKEKVSEVRQPEAADGVAWWIIVVAVVGGVILCLVIVIVILVIRRSERNADKQIPDKTKDASEGNNENSGVPPNNALQAMKTYLHLDSMPKNESELTSDRKSALDVSEGVVGTSSRGSVTSQGTARDVKQ